MVYCSRCGAENDDFALKCKRCGEPLRRVEGDRYGQPKSNDLAELSWQLSCTLARVQPSEIKWLNRIFSQGVTDDDKRAEIFRYAIERVEYSAANPTVPTGIEELDDILYGGVPKGYAILITSPPLDEKDLLIDSFLKQGIYREDAVLFFSTRLRGIASELVDGNPESFFLMLCNPWADNIIGDRPNVLKFNGVEDLTQLNISLEVFFRNIAEEGVNIRRVVLDIVSDALLTHEIRVVRRWLMDLLTMFKHRDMTIISTLDPDMHSRDESRTIIDLFDGHMDISEREVNDELKKILAIKRLYNKKYLEKDLILTRDKFVQLAPTHYS